MAVEGKSKSNAAIAVIESGYSDCTVQGELSQAASNAPGGLAFRVKSWDEYWLVTILPAGMTGADAEYSLIRFTQDGPDVVHEGYGLFGDAEPAYKVVPMADDLISVSLSGANIHIKVTRSKGTGDVVLDTTATEPDSNLTAYQSHGIATDDADFRLTNFAISNCK